MDLFAKQYHAPGTTPGKLTEKADTGASAIIFDYGPDYCNEADGSDVDVCREHLNSPGNTWVHLQGAPDVSALRSLSESLAIDTLYLEDVVNTGQRPKLDTGDQLAFVILTLPVTATEGVTMEQISLFLGNGYVISVCSGDVNPFNLVFQRLRQPGGRLRKSPMDYLFYALIDAVIDHGFPMLERYAERIENLEDVLIEKPDADVLQEIHRLRRELLLLRRQLWPQREVINSLVRDLDSDLISDETRKYLRDCYDHVIYILELLQTYWEMSSGMLEVYLSSMSHRMNNVMRLLTIIATLFIPPTFLVGVYGMNFNPDAGPWSMPELASPYGYAAVWLVILVMVVSMLFYFRRHDWL